MTPNPENIIHVSTLPSKTDSPLELKDDTIVISGMSGRFPKSRTVADFKHNLYNKIDMVEPCDSQWKAINEVVPDRYGQTMDIEKFDSTFFAIHSEFGNYMDPQGRMILEHVYESIVDAGISPKNLRGSNTGVFLGCCFVDSHEACIRDRSGKELTGSLRTLLANHISYVMDFKGPSFVIDTACSSSGYAADVALKALQNGECDQAILAGTNLLLGPTLSLVFLRMGVLSKDGHSRTFDEDASGYCRADGIVSLFLQKSKDAKRIYARFLHGKKNVDGFKKEGFPFPSRVMQIKLFEDFYKEIGVDPNLVGYIEAHSTGTRVGDPEECSGLDQVFCSNRKNPLPIGSVKSNMGHSEGASTTCSIVKSILAFETKKLAPNLHLKQVRSGIPAFEQGKLKVVDEVEDFDGSLIGINSFGVGGANVHLLLQAHDKEKVNGSHPTDDLPRMVLWSGRTEEAVNSILKNVEENPLDVEYLALLNSSQVSTAVLNTYRGYGIFSHDPEDGSTKCLGKGVINYLDSKRPIVFVYTGMGAQWTQMLSDLRKIPIFNASIDKCHQVLLTKNVNLIDILSSPDEKMLQNVLHAYVGIAAIQIGLTDVLRALDINPDFIIGHSVGELGCAYADGCNSAEEIILSAYSRGMATIETQIIHGAMAAVGVGHEELKEILIDGIEIACHNSSNSSTVSGPAEVVAAFIEKLKSEKIFVKEVNSSNIPYHSSYISQMGPNLLKRLKEIIKNPKERSSKWLSTSVPKDMWDNQDNKLSSADYHTNNLLNPVLFQEALEMLPKEALTIEVAPSGLLQAILRRALPDGVHVSLTKKDEKENSVNLMSSLGRIFQNGADMDISKLYPPVAFPVSRGTPMISPLIKWDHSQNFNQFKIEDIEVNEMKAVLMLRDPNFDFLTGHKIEGKMIFPATGYLYLACRLAAAHHKKRFEEFDVEFEDIKFLSACFISFEKDTVLNIVLQGGDGRFEVREGKTLMCTGFIRPTTAKLTPFEKPKNEHIPSMNNQDFYKELRIRGYHYEKLFKSVVTAKIDSSEVTVKWDSNWIAFMDCLAQAMILRKDLRTPVVPTRLRRVILKPTEYLDALKKLENSDDEITATAYYIPELDMVRCDGMEFRGFGFLPIPKRPQPGHLVHQNYKFIPHNPTPLMSQDDAASFCVQLALENSQMLKIKSLEIDAGDEKEILNQSFIPAIENVPIVGAELVYCTDREFEEKPLGVELKKLEAFEKLSEFDFIIKSKCLEDAEFITQIQDKLNENGFLVSRESKDASSTFTIPENFKLIAKIVLENELLILLKFVKIPFSIPSNLIEVSMTSVDNYKWLDKVKETYKTESTIMYAEGEYESGILGLVNCIRREPNGSNVKCVFVDDHEAPKFDVENKLYKEQLEKGLAMNVYRNRHWGSYRHLKLEPKPIKEISQKTMAVVEIPSKGDFSSLKWFESPLKFNHKDEIITIHYAALNFRDIMLGSGRVPVTLFGDKRINQQQFLGFEYTGVTSNGRQVMGIVPKSALATHVIPDNVVVMDLPKGWKMEEGTTIFGTYGTVFLGLFVKSQIKRGNSILIHAGSGGVGLSAIHVALAMEMEVFTTVSTEEKKNYLVELFPKLKPENIGNSRDTTFEDMVMVNTKGKGVDFVLNSLADDKLLASVRCLSKGGTFVEIGKSDIIRDNKINLGHFAKEITFLSLNIDIFVTADKEDKKRFLEYVKEGIKKDYIKPLKTTVFDANQLEEAFRFLASGKHIGKVVIKVRGDDDELLIKDITPRVFFDPRCSYIICGGLGGFGMELADWMIIRGCRKLVLSSSRGILEGFHHYKFSLWKSCGVDIRVSTADITSMMGCYELVSEATYMGQVDGIFNLAAKLNDAILDNQTVESFEQCMATKATATKYLDEVSRQMCSTLHHFVVFSSVSCGLGNAGQSNYGMANSVMERIIEKRQRAGLPAKAIQWGAIGDVGIVARIMDEKKADVDMEISGTMMQSIYSCLEVLDTLLTSEEPIVTSMVVAEKLNTSGGRAGMLQQLLKILGIKDINAYPKDTKIVDFGMDSLLTVEVLQHAEKELNVELTIDDFRSMTLAELIELTKEDGKPFVKKNNPTPKVEEVVDETNPKTDGVDSKEDSGIDTDAAEKSE